MADISAPPPGLDEYVATLDNTAPTTPTAPQPQPMAQNAAPPTDVPEGLDDYVKDLDEEKYGTVPEMAKTFAEGAASSATFGLSTGVEKALGVKPEDIAARRETNPGSHIAGQITGLLVPGSLAGKALGAAGKGAAALVDLAEPVTVAQRIGSGAVKAAVENGLFQAGDDVSKMFSGQMGDDPGKAFETAVTDVGLAAVLGGGIGAGMTGGAEGAKALWGATMGKETTGLLNAIKNKAGGIEGQAEDNVLDQALMSTGLAEGMSPEVRAAMSQDPAISELASVLRQTDSNASGMAYQQAEQSFRQRVGEVQAETMGFSPGELPTKGDLDKYSHGRNIGETLAKEYDTVVKPLSEEYETLRAKYAKADLVPSIAERAETSAKAQDKAFGRLQKAQQQLQKALKANSPEDAIHWEGEMREAKMALDDVAQSAKKQGTVDSAIEKINTLAEKEGWTMSPSSDIMREVNRVVKELPNAKTLNKLSQYITQVGENTASKLPYGMSDPVSRAGGLMQRILREAEGDVMGHFVGSEEGVGALERYGQLRKSYAEAAGLKDQISDAVGVRGSTANYGKALRGMAEQDGEKLLARAAGGKDAAWLKFVEEKFPQTAEAIKKYHLEQIVSKSIDKDGTLSSKKLINYIDTQMSPQLREFTLSQEQLAKLKTSDALLERLNSGSHNFSNTARTIDKVLGGLPGSALGMAVGALTHNPIIGAVAGLLTKTVGKDVPDAGRLALLKFLGSDRPVSAAGFKSMVEMIQATIKGENLTGKVVKDLFTAGREVLPSHLMPSERERTKLDKELQKAQADGGRSLMNLGNDAAHYLPQHAGAAAQTTMNAVNYLNTLRPSQTKMSPLDAKPIISQADKAKFDRALNIAQQPLVVLHHMKQGTLTQGDVQTMRTLYPSLYRSISSKLTEQVSDSVQKGKIIPYSTRMGLSMFLGQPLDSTMTPQAVMAIQAVQQGPSQQDAGQQPQVGGGGQQPPKHSTTSLGKLPGMYQSPDAARQARALKN